MPETGNSLDNPLPTIRIRPPKKWVPVDLHELWAYRELIYSFTLRDIKLRYKQTGLGIAWAVLQPLLTMLIFTIFFGGLAKIPSDGVPYPLFVLAALLPWTLFASGLTRSTTSMVTDANIMTKVYFPRMIIPLASIISPLVDLAVSFVILIIMMIYYGFAPTLNIVFLPLFVLLSLATSLGVGLWLSALNVKYRDFQVHCPLPYPDLDVCITGRVCLQPCAGIAACLVRPQPDDRCDRRVPLGAARFRGAQCDGARLGGYGHCAPCLRYVLLPEDGTVLRGYRLIFIENTRGHLDR